MFIHLQDARRRLSTFRSTMYMAKADMRSVMAPLEHLSAAWELQASVETDSSDMT